MMERVVTAAIVAAAIIGVAVAIYFPPDKGPQCLSDEITVQEKSNGPWWCVKARKP